MTQLKEADVLQVFDGEAEQVLHCTVALRKINVVVASLKLSAKAKQVNNKGNIQLDLDYLCTAVKERFFIYSECECNWYTFLVAECCVVCIWDFGVNIGRTIDLPVSGVSVRTPLAGVSGVAVVGSLASPLVARRRCSALRRRF